MRTPELTSVDYHSFYQPYIDAVGDVDLMEMMRRQLENFPKFIQSIPDERWHTAYGPSKWTIAEVLQHVVDAERVFQYRALRIARNDQTPLPGFDQDAYVPFSGAEKQTKESMIEAYRAVRQSSLSLFATFDREILGRKGISSNATVSVGALGFIICGHQKHHRNILRERYLADQS